MSWVSDFMPNEPPRPPYKEADDTPKRPDPSIPGRMVADKPANRPFLAHKEYRLRREAAHQAWVERQKEREAKIARGEKVGPPERDPTAEEEVGLLGLLKFFAYLLVFALLAGKFFTGSWTWEYQAKLAKLKEFIPPADQRLFSERLLSEYDGKTRKSIYLGIDGDVYDVTKGTAYQPGGSYEHFAGIDGARAFGTGCFKDHRTHDIRGLDDDELASLIHWKKFYAEHTEYRKVGRVQHKPIDPASPIPKHCDRKRRKQLRRLISPQ